MSSVHEDTGGNTTAHFLDSSDVGIFPCEFERHYSRPLAFLLHALRFQMNVRIFSSYCMNPKTLIFRNTRQ